MSSGIKTVVIDPGHGGKDPGCHGGLTNEKTVVLAIGLKLGEYIKSKYPNINVIYTRDSDEFIELDNRAKIANDNHADVFISIHANAGGSAAYGTETYVLGLHRTESQQEVAERENSTILFEENSDEKYKDFELTPDAIIARQLQLSVFLNQSINLASKIQAQFKGIGRRDRGVKQAGFIVLYKTTMPSVLIETGFLTNPTEENFLADNKSQQKMAEAMFVAFQKYKNELDGVDIMKGVTPTKEYVLEPKTATKVEPKKEDSKKEEPKTAIVSSESHTNKVVFRVQIETASKKLSLSDNRFKSLSVYEYFQDGLYKYTSGEFVNDFKAANEHKNEMRENGYPNAFVVAFYNGERIALDEALKRSK